MAVAFASVQSTGATGTNVTITKPTSLAVGDLMVAHLYKQASSSPTIDTLSGWTSLLNTANGNSRTSVQYKIADSGDVAASNFTFTGGGTDAFMSGAIWRITGTASTPIDTNSTLNTWSGTSADIAMGITPARASNLLLILVGGSGIGSDSDFSGYAIATSNPSWTEAYDVNGTSNLSQIAGAYAIRPEITATGNVSFSSSGSASAGQACIISIQNILDATVSLDVATLASSAPEPTVTGGATVNLDVATLASVAPELNAGQADWSSQQKSNSPTWTAQPKN